MLDPCPKCRGTKRVIVEGQKNGRFYRKKRRCSECSPLNAKTETPPATSPGPSGSDPSAT